MSYTKYNWKNLYEEFLTTNLSPGAFAMEKGLPSSCAYAQFKKLGYKPDPIKSNNRKKKSEDDIEEVNIVPVEIVPAKPVQKTLPQKAATISLSIGSATIHLEEGFNKALLKDTLEVLQEIC